MSAYANPQNLQGQIEGLAGSLRGLDQALAQEKERSRKLAEELSAARKSHESVQTQLEARNRELELSHEKIKAALTLHQQNDQKIGQQYRALHAGYLRLRDELNQYRSAWAEVLQREKEAKLIIMEGDKSRERVRELEVVLDRSGREANENRSRSEQLERHLKTYQDELQATLVRLHSAEAKFAELSKELEAQRASRRNMDEEISKIEASLQERMQWGLLKEREKVRAELEKQSAQQLEQDREYAREAFNEFRQRLEAEVTRLTQALASEERQTKQLSAAMISEKIRHENELLALESELASIRQMVAQTASAELAEHLELQHHKLSAIRTSSVVTAGPDPSAN